MNDINKEFLPYQEESMRFVDVVSSNFDPIKGCSLLGSIAFVYLDIFRAVSHFSIDEIMDHYKEKAGELDQTGSLEDLIPIEWKEK